MFQRTKKWRTVGVYFGWWGDLLNADHSVGNWIGVSSNLLFLSFLMVIMVPILFDGLQKNLTETEELRIQLKEQQRELAFSLEELKEKNSELEKFAHVVSHDLQEPLRMVKGFMDQLDKKYADRLDDKARRYIHFARDGAIRMKQILLDLLTYSRAGE